MAPTLPALNNQSVGAQLYRLNRVFESTHGRYANNPCSLELFHTFGRGRPAIANGTNTLLDAKVNDVLCEGHIHMKINPKGCVGLRFYRQNTGLNLIQCHDGTCKKAKTAGLCGRSDQGRISDPPHGSLDNRVSATKKFCERSLHDRRCTAVTVTACTLLASWKAGQRMSASLDRLKRP